MDDAAALGCPGAMKIPPLEAVMEDAAAVDTIEVAWTVEEMLEIEELVPA